MREENAFEERKKGGNERRKSSEKEGEIRRRNHLLHQWMRVSHYRYIATHEWTLWCACKRVKRRDIFYIYGYLPLLCSRTGGLWQRANRPLLLLLSLSRLSLLAPWSISARWPLSGASIEASLFVLPATVALHRASSSPSDTLAGNTGHTGPATRPCVISHAIPYSVPTMICSRLVPR